MNHSLLYQSVDGLLTVRTLNTIRKVLFPLSTIDFMVDVYKLSVYDLWYFRDRIFNNRYCGPKTKAEITDLLNTLGL